MKTPLSVRDRSVLREAAPALLWRSLVDVWSALAGAIAASVPWMLSWSLVLIAFVVGDRTLAIVGLAPPAVMVTGLARFARMISRHERARVRDALRVDPVVGATLAAALVAIGFGMTWDHGGLLVAQLCAAVLLVLAPYLVARSGTGWRAWRAAVILVALRPSYALVLAALNVVIVFAVAATFGVAGLVLPCVAIVFADRLVGLLEAVFTPAE